MDWEKWKQGAVRVDVGATTVAGYDVGNANAASMLTFCHGYPSASLDIAPVAAILGEPWRVLAVDFPGFGASPPPPIGGEADPCDSALVSAAEPAEQAKRGLDAASGRTFPLKPRAGYSIHGAADAVEAWWSARGVSATLLVAHDYGVSVAQELLARRADRQLDVAIKGLVWMNGGLYPDLHRPTLGQQLLLDPEHGAEFAASITEATFTDAIRATWGTRRPADDVVLHEMFTSLDDGGGVRRMHELLHYIADRRQHAARWRAALEGCDLPMTFVWGDLDPVSGAHMIERVEERIPAADMRRLADVGHWPPLEAPTDVASAITSMP